MSININIDQRDPVAPTPQNTPLQYAPIFDGLSRPTVPDITEDNEADEDEPVVGQRSARDARTCTWQALRPHRQELRIRQKPPSGCQEEHRSPHEGVQVKYVELPNQYKRELLESSRKRCVLLCRREAVGVIEDDCRGDVMSIWCMNNAISPFSKVQSVVHISTGDRPTPFAVTLTPYLSRGLLVAQDHHRRDATVIWCTTFTISRSSTLMFVVAISLGDRSTPLGMRRAVDFFVLPRHAAIVSIGHVCLKLSPFAHRLSRVIPCGANACFITVS